jgi:hypothetical protein
MSGRNDRDTETTSTFHHGAVSQVRLRHTRTGGLWERVLVILGGALLVLAIIDRLFF